jgi:Integrase
MWVSKTYSVSSEKKKEDIIMATLNRKKSGCWSIQYDLPGERRKTITLPSRFEQRLAEDLRNVIGKLIYFRENGLDYRTEDKRLRTWIETANPRLRNKLANHGFIKIPKRITTKELWQGFLTQKEEVAESTLDTYVAAQTRFFTFFKEDEWITDLTEDRMIDWKKALKERYAEATVAGTLAKAKAVFNWAVKQQGLEANPLKDVERGSYKNRKNDRYITEEEYYRLLEAAVCQEWRVIFALVRVGGLRAPSEILGVRWSKVDWESNTFSFVDSKRKERNGDPFVRTVPLFPALRVELEALYERDRDLNPEFVINRYRDPKTNLGTQFARISRAAGLDKIPRPFDNMRASRSTEINKLKGPKAESEWIGHSQKTAFEHYLMVTNEDVADAANWKF